MVLSGGVVESLEEHDLNTPPINLSVSGLCQQLDKNVTLLMAGLVTPRWLQTMVNIRGVLYVFGGLSQLDGRPLRSSRLYFFTSSF